MGKLGFMGASRQGADHDKGLIRYYIGSRSTSRLKPAARTSLALCLLALIGCTPPAPYGLASRVPTKPYLQMPPLADGKIPALLSQTGVFSDTARRIPNTGLIPYELIEAF